MLACGVLCVLVVWSLLHLDERPVHSPESATLVLGAFALIVAYVVRRLRASFGVSQTDLDVVPDPLYTLYLAAIILAGTSGAVLIAALIPLIESAPDHLKAMTSRQHADRITQALRGSAFAAATTFLAGEVFMLTSHALGDNLGWLRSHVIGALLASVIIFTGIGLARALDGWSVGKRFIDGLQQYFNSPAIRFQILLLSIGPLLPLAERLDDVEAEFTWALFLVPLGAVYYLALVSVRLQRRSQELQATIGQLRTARRREAELTDFAALITRAQEEERKRLARELHDDTSQALIALSRGLDTLTSHYPPLASHDARFLGELGELSKRTLESVRRACQNLRPSVLDDLGLPAALESLAQSITNRGKACTFRQSGNYETAPPEVEVTIYRIAQEALTNAFQHSQAAHLFLEITYHPREVEVLVRDDGVGFDYLAHASTDGDAANSQPDTRPHLGLLGMRERASLIGARLHVESSPERGTLVSLMVPLPQSTSLVTAPE